MTYTVVVTRSAAKELARIGKGDPTVRKQLTKAVAALAENPRPDRCLKLTGIEGYRVRVREYRILYTITDETVTVEVFRIAKRGAAY